MRSATGVSPNRLARVGLHPNESDEHRARVAGRSSARCWIYTNKIALLPTPSRPRRTARYHRTVHRSAALALALLATSACLAPLAAAQDSAEQLVDEGIALREQRQDAEALERFDRAYDLDPQPRTMVQIALAEQALGRYAEAEAHLATALASTGDRFIRRNRRVLEGALAEIRENLGTVQIEGGVEGARLQVGDRDAGGLPLAEPLRLAAGAHTLTVAAEGYEPFTREIEVVAGETSTVAVELTALPPPAPEEEPEPEPLVEPTSAPSSEGSADWLTIAGITGLGVGAVGVGIGVAFMLVREDHARARLTCSDTEQACRDHYQGALDAEAAGIASFVIGGVFAAAGATLLALGLVGGGSSSGSSEDTAWACAPTLLGATCAGTF